MFRERLEPGRCAAAAIVATRRRSVGSGSPTVPAAGPGRKSAAQRTQGLKLEREGLSGAPGAVQGRGSRRRLRSRGRSRARWPARGSGREIMLDGPRKLGEDAPPPSSGSIVAESLPLVQFAAIRLTMKPSEGVSRPFLPPELVAAPAPENGSVLKHAIDYESVSKLSSIDLALRPKGGFFGIV